MLECGASGDDTVLKALKQASQIAEDNGVFDYC